jgi:hypothetical protein
LTLIQGTSNILIGVRTGLRKGKGKGRGKKGKELERRGRGRGRWKREKGREGLTLISPLKLN